MKQFIIKTIFGFLTGLYGIQLAYAGAVAGGATEWTQMLNNVQLLGTNAGITITAAQQTISTTKETILDPIANALISVALQQVVNNTVNWANGGFQGQPLLISNPQRFTQNAGLNAVKVSLSGIPQNSVYGNSIFSAVVSSVRNDSPTTQLQSLSQSPVPSIVQNNFCNENNLNQTALDDVRKSDGTYNTAEFTSRKIELYNSLCVGNPNTDPILSQKLIAVNNQKPSIGGNSVFLETIGGSANQYKNTVRSTIIANDIKTAASQATKEDITRGGGYSSETKCTKYVTDPNGVDVCDESTVITPSGSVQSMVSGAVNAPVARITNIQGAGALSGIITNLINKFISGGGLTSAFSSTPSNQSTSNAVVPLKNNSPVVNDLTSDPITKNYLVENIQKEFTSYGAMLNNLDSIDSLYLANVNSYEARLNSTKDCYINLSGSSTPALVYPEFFSFYSQRMVGVSNLKTFLTLERNNITAAKALINSSSLAINKSNSSQEISNIYTDYKNQLVTKSYPLIGSDTTRQGEYMSNKTSSDNDTTLANFQTACTNPSQQGGY